MASDISSIIQSEFINTFESLLSVEASVVDIVKAEDIGSTQCIKIDIDFTAKPNIQSKWKFLLPTAISTKFEYLMLGGIGEEKTLIDDEILDATKEIINTICGSLSTSVNAQGFDDIKSANCTIVETEVISPDSLDNYNNLYKFIFTFNQNEVEMFIQFDDNILPYLGKIVSGEEITQEEEEQALSGEVVTANIPAGAASILSLLGEESVQNLELLFNVKLKFAVRLGTKTFLLKDIVNWDIGKIIELDQMVNEPLDILINGIKVGEGEAVIVEGKFGVKIKTIGKNQLEV